MILRYQGGELQHRRWLVGGLIILGVTLALLALPPGDGLARLSYDLPFLFRGNLADTNVVVLIEDRATLDALGQTTFPPARTVHARLLDKLSEEGASLVVFDISFRAPKPGEDERFAAAITRHGHVILGGVVETVTQQTGDSAGASIVEIKPPAETLRAAAAGWGLLLLGNQDSIFGVRKIIAQWQDHPTVPWLAAQAGGRIKPSDNPQSPRWINFYGPSPALDQVTLGQVLGVAGRTMPPGYLRGRVVFVGFDASVTPASGRRDSFTSPYTLAGRDFIPGVEILATIYANLAHENWLRPMPLLLQTSLAAGFGAVAFVALVFSGRRWLWLTGAGLFTLLAVVAILLQWRFQFWWNWLALGLVQLPLTVLLALLCPRLPVLAFISYRRKGGDAFAMAVLSQLRARGIDAFLDIDRLGRGDFSKQIFSNLDRIPNVLVILSPGALGTSNEPDDWLQKEISYAFAQDKNIIPVILDGFEYPKGIPLPAGMEPLPLQQSVLHHHDKWDATMAEIKKYLKG